LGPPEGNIGGFGSGRTRISVALLISSFLKKGAGSPDGRLFMDQDVVGQVANGRYQTSSFELGWRVDADENGGQAAYLLETAENDVKQPVSFRDRDILIVEG
jgi:hypothetical protein